MTSLDPMTPDDSHSSEDSLSEQLLSVPLSKSRDKDKENPFDFVGGVSNNDLAVLVSYLTGNQTTDDFVKMFSLFGRETLLFCALFEGRIIKVPKISWLLKVKGYCQIYAYVKARDFQEYAYQEAADKFKKRVPHIKNVVAKVEREIATISDGNIIYPDKSRSISDPEE